MSLFDLYKKAKKKKKETFAPVKQKVSSGLGSTANTFKKFKSGIDSKVGKIADKSFQKFEQVKAQPKGGDWISKKLSQTKFFKPQAGKVRFRDYVRELPGANRKAKIDTAKMFGQDITRAGISLYEAPQTIKNKKASKKFYNTPFGRLNSIQSESQNRLDRGESIPKVIGHAVLDTAFGIGDVGAVARPALSTVKKVAPKMAKHAPKLKGALKEVENFADDLIAPMGKTRKVIIPARVEPVSPNIRDLHKGSGTFKINPKTGKSKKVDGFVMDRREKPTRIPEMTINEPFEWRSKTMQSFSRPGLTLKETDLGQLKNMAKKARSSRNFDEFMKGLSQEKDVYEPQILLLRKNKVKLKDFYERAIKTSKVSQAKKMSNVAEISQRQKLNQIKELKESSKLSPKQPKTAPKMEKGSDVPFEGRYVDNFDENGRLKSVKQVLDSKNQRKLSPQKIKELEKKRSELDSMLFKIINNADGKNVDDVNSQLRPIQDELIKVLSKLGKPVPSRTELNKTNVLNYATRLSQLGYKENQINKIGPKLGIKVVESRVSPWMFKKWYMETGQRASIVPARTEGLDSEKFKDISNPAKGTYDVYRNFERFFGKNNQRFKKTLLDPFDESKGLYIDDQRKWLGNLQKNIVDDLGIKRGTKESSAVQAYGEGKLSLEALQKQFPNSWENIVKADQWFRKAYDKLLDEVNEVRRRIYPSHPLVPESDKTIPKRKDYYRHFQEMSDGFKGLKNIFDTPANISSELAGVSDFTKPKSKWLSLAQRRKGDETTMDAVGGFLDYIKSSSFSKNIDPHIQQFRGLREELVNRVKDTNMDGKINSFIEFLNDYANDLAGKTNPVDRPIQKYIPGGRKMFAVINWMNSRVKANVVLGNASSSIAQFFNIPQGFANAGTRNSMKAVGKTLNGIFKENNAMKKSSFISERYFDDFARFDVGVLKYPKKFAIWMTQVGDEIGTKFIWNAHYEKALKEGVSNPIKYADDWTRKMVAGRGVGEVPLLQKSKLTQLVAPFQLEVVNAWHVMSDWARSDAVMRKKLGVFMKFFVATYLMNAGAKKVRGSDVSFNPINAMMEAIESYQKEDDKKIGMLNAGGRVAGEFLSNIPLGDKFAENYPKYGKTVFGKQLPTREDLFGEGDPTRFGSTGLIGRGLLEPQYKLIPPFSGMQIKRTKEGVESYLRGFSETPKGNIQFPIDKTNSNMIKTAIFGKYSTPEARDYFENEQTPLSDLQGEKFKLLGNSKDYFDKVMSDRKANRDVSKQLELLKKGKTGDVEALSSDMFKLSNGKIYVSSLDKQFDSVQKAQEEMVKEEFRNTDKKYMRHNGRVYYKTSDGKIPSMSEEQYQNKLFTAQMKNSKERKDIEGWFVVADKKLQNLENQLDDPNIDELSKIEIENDIISLLNDVEKFASYGGFTKPKKAKKPKELDFDSRFFDLGLTGTMGGGSRLTNKLVRSNTRGIKKARRAKSIKV